MFKWNHVLGFGVLFASASLLGIAACSTDVAGGVSEETNTLAGILVNSKGQSMPGVAVVARHMNVDTLVYTDTTDGSGKFAFPLYRQGVYGLSAKSDSMALYRTVRFSGQKQEGLSLEMAELTSLKGRVVLDSSLMGKGIVVSLPGTSWSTETDSAGLFEFKGIPVGSYAVMVESPDPIRYVDAVYQLDATRDDATLSGPLPASDERVFVNEGDTVRFNFGTADAEKNVVQLPLSTEYGLFSWWSMDYASVDASQRTLRDARGHADGILLYGDAELVDGVFGKALALRGADQFGVVENDNGALDSADQFTVELLLKLDSAKSGSGYRKNIMGKLGFGAEGDHDVFSLALVEGGCGAEGARLAFFLADGSGDSLSCENAAVSSKNVEFDSWFHLVVVFEAGTIRMYENGNLVAEKETQIELLESSDEPIFFGKENLNLMLDDVRLGKKAITSADVLYRYNLKGGAL
ncbi:MULTISPECIES: LamG-like jellyroll fold domain-containing protein [unclassified Fibrobacter]|uniref:LamG-like jellyroll fold domain-containing protein n=1 Tax=unclassified Fibrobacter TaxID=2634177 RepID=UPI000D7B00BC|nr:MULTISPECIES: LamG-like jellyroll fold domain-containing protein [unclassified Fibrobacter]PWJ67103.1 concanavalin A-like lectin/glucanase superfamily protein [Fibrobacter sp. UWR4]PZW70670.1 concanavalin A-like lectin/glucanase superfamily protein [Fibrobacter sp. UWR1]